jgi:hypothetical protein
MYSRMSSVSLPMTASRRAGHSGSKGIASETLTPAG